MSEIRSRCAGVLPLTARLEPWQRELAARPDWLAEWITEHGSPVNVIEPSCMGPNAEELARVAAERDVPLRIFFARKANKALSLVDEAKRLGHGVDVASERELRQVLDRDVPASDVIVTAAIKPKGLLELCLERGVNVAIDNFDELELMRRIAQSRGKRPKIALRLAPAAGARATRFGIPAVEIDAALSAGALDQFAIAGLHFHLDGYDAGERVAAIGESLSLVDSLHARNQDPGFLDIGGGIPMSYLESEAEWDGFWEEHRRALAGDRDELTFDGHDIGKVYPYHQSPVRGQWLAGILDSALFAGTIADELRSRGLELRMEPGRALLDGCGMTAARVEFRKQRADGTWLVGLAMNRTQMRSTSDDFMVDPLLARPAQAGEPTAAIEGYLVGAYCIERELLSWRRFSFPAGVAIGDVLLFPNTAGYLMHILESASHQIPLARNLIIDGGGEPSLDPIDAAG